MAAFELPASLCSEDALIMRTRVPFRARLWYQLSDDLDFHAQVSAYESDAHWTVKRFRQATRGLHRREIT